MGNQGLCQFLIFCQDKEDVTRVKADISMQPGCVVDSSDNSQWVAQKISEGEAKCLIFNCQTFNTGSLKRVSALRGTTSRLPVIVIAEKVEKDILQFNYKAQNLVIIERKQYNYGVMFDLCTKVRQNRPVYRRAHERFTTSQSVLIEKMTDHKLCVGVMNNMSRGGAFLEAGGLLSEGDILKITVDLPEVKKAHIVFGEVVRIVTEGYPPGECGAGIRYISPQDLYTALLENS